MAQGQQRQPAADVLQPGPHRSERSRGRLPRRRRPAPDARRRQDRRHRRRASRPTTTSTRSGSTRRTPTTSSSATTAASPSRYDKAKTWIFVPEPAGRPLLPRQRRHGDAVQRLRRHAGQLQLVRPERRARRRRHRATTTGPRCRAATASSSLQDPTDYRIAYSESQDGNIVRVDRVTGETMCDPAAGRRPGEPALRWHWDTPLMHVAARSQGRSSPPRNKVFRSADRGLSWTAISGDLTDNAEPRRDRDDGREGQRHPDLRGTTASRRGRRSSRSPSRRSAPGVSTPAPTTAIVQVSRDGGRRGRTSPTRCQGVPKGICVSEVVPSRFDEGDRLRDVRRASPERLRDLHLREQRLRPDVASRSTANLKGEVARTLTEDQKNPDVLYLGTETGLFVSHRSRRRAGRGSRRTCRRSASTRSRCTRATTR